MKRLIYSFLFLLLIATGCKKNPDLLSTSPELNKEVIASEMQSKTVTTMDGTLTAFSGLTLKMKSGEIYQIYKPDNWNGDLILYAHGYVSAYEPLAISTESNAYAPFFISQGYAFATTSYSANGLVIQSGIDDILDLRKYFIKQYGQPSHIYLTGGSEGGLITTLAVERYPKLFSGGLSLCGPCGDFQRQINHYGDFRVLFDYFFPGVLPGDAVNIPNQLIQNWNSVYVPLILQAISANPVATQKLLVTAGLSFVLQNPANIPQPVLGLLWYDVFGTPNANEVLKGQPFDNTTRVYVNPLGTASENLLLNQQVQRFAADKKATKTIEKDYQTTGDIDIPLVKMHTTGDFLIPFWHLPLYQAKINLQGNNDLFTGYPVDRFGHCTFTEVEIITGFAALVQNVSGQVPNVTQRLINVGRASDGKVVRSVEGK